MDPDNEEFLFNRIANAVNRAGEQLRNMRAIFAGTAERFQRVTPEKEVSKHRGSKNTHQKRNKTRAKIARTSKRINGRYGKGMKKR